MTPLAGMTTEGTVHHLDFEFTGDEFSSKGNVICEYSDLKIATYNDGRDKEFIKSLFGNLMIRNNNRKLDSANFKEGEIYFVRYQNKDFFNYLWNSIRVGLMDIVVPFYQNPDLENPVSGPKFQEDKY
ncbi:unnamed protein product [Chrysoparadoxa australica]